MTTTPVPRTASSAPGAPRAGDSDRLTALLHVAAQVASSSVLRVTLAAILSAACDLLRTDGALIAAYEGDGEGLTVYAQPPAGTGEAEYAEAFRHSPWEPVAQRVMHSQQPAVTCESGPLAPG